MKKLIVFITLLICASTLGFAQSAKNELENGYKLNSAEKLFLYFSEDGKMKVSVDETFSNPLTYPDSTLFLVPNVGVNVYMRPMNPLKGTTSHDLVVISDPATDAAEEALSAMLSLFEQTTSHKPSPASSSDNEINKIISEPINTTSLNKELKKSSEDSLRMIIVNQVNTLVNQVNTIAEIVNNNSIRSKENKQFVSSFESQADSIKKRLSAINDEIQKKRQQDVKGLFKELKELDFRHETQTLNSLTKIEDSLKVLKQHYSEIEKHIKSARNKKDSLMVPMNYISALVLNEMEKVKDGQFKIVKEFDDLFKMVNTYAQKAKSGADGVGWVISLGDLATPKGKILTFSVELKSGKYTFDEDKNSIAEVTPSSLGKHSFKVKKFQRFVPEVVYGTAYTFIDYPVYGTTEDESGNQVVVQSGNERINNLNISGMINFNYFVPNSPIHPLIQTGIGINNEIPTLLVGGGLRVHINDTRFAITGGMALTWVKKLDELSEGDIVSGTADIDEDLTFQFDWPPKPYVGLQFKF